MGFQTIPPDRYIPGHLHIAGGLLDVTGAGSTTELRIDNTATDGDPVLALQLGGVSQFTMGVDDGDSDYLKWGTSAIGTATFLTARSTGEISAGTGTPYFTSNR